MFVTQSLLRRRMMSHHDFLSGFGPCYYTDLEPMIESAVDLTHWVHGHTHNVKSYQIGNTTVLSNARGYIGVEYLAETFKIRSFET
jgi:hypothetical protein